MQPRSKQKMWNTAIYSFKQGLVWESPIDVFFMIDDIVDWKWNDSSKFPTGTDTETGIQ